MAQFVKLTVVGEALPVYVNVELVQEIYATATGCNLVFAWHEGHTSVTETPEQILAAIEKPAPVEVTEAMVEAGLIIWHRTTGRTDAVVRAIITAALEAR